MRFKNLELNIGDIVRVTTTQDVEFVGFVYNVSTSLLFGQLVLCIAPGINRGNKAYFNFYGDYIPFNENKVKSIQLIIQLKVNK